MDGVEAEQMQFFSKTKNAYLCRTADLSSTPMLGLKTENDREIVESLSSPKV